MLTSLSELVSEYEQCITDSVADSAFAIEKKYALNQTRHGRDTALKTLITALIIAEIRRRALEQSQNANS